MADRSMLLSKIQEIADQLDQEIADVERRRDMLTVNLMELRALRRRLNGPRAKPAPRRVPSSSGMRSGGPPSERQAQIIDAIRGVDDAFFSAQDLKEACGTNDATLYQTLNVLRDLGAIGKAHKAAIRSGTTPRQYWRIMDAAALDQARSGRDTA